MSVWKAGDVDLLSKFTEFKGQHQPRFSLAKDGIADVTPGSSFFGTLSKEQQMLAATASISSKDMEEKWPSLSSILSRVCVRTHSYDDVVKALRREDVSDPIVEYLRDMASN